MDNRVGQQIGNYRLVSLLGRGGYANVYLGEHLHLKTQAAIKILQIRLAGNTMEQFRSEAQAIASLVHPHIVRVLDFGVENGIPFLVMDYAPGGSLRSHHPRGERLPPAEPPGCVAQRVADQRPSNGRSKHEPEVDRSVLSRQAGENEDDRAGDKESEEHAVLGENAKEHDVISIVFEQVLQLAQRPLAQPLERVEVVVERPGWRDARQHDDCQRADQY